MAQRCGIKLLQISENANSQNKIKLETNNELTWNSQKKVKWWKSKQPCIHFYNNTIPTVFRESERRKKIIWISCLWHFILLGPIFAFWEERGWMGEEEEFEAKLGLFYSMTAVIVCMYIRQMCLNETCVWLCVHKSLTISLFPWTKELAIGLIHSLLLFTLFYECGL